MKSEFPDDFLEMKWSRKVSQAYPWLGRVDGEQFRWLLESKVGEDRRGAPMYMERSKNSPAIFRKERIYPGKKGT